jgi:hypothetical protein
MELYDVKKYLCEPLGNRCHMKQQFLFAGRFKDLKNFLDAYSNFSESQSSPCFKCSLLNNCDTVCDTLSNWLKSQTLKKLPLDKEYAF